MPSMHRAWGYPPKQVRGELRNQGRVCFYCMRVFQARYHGKMFVKEMRAFLGRDEGEHTRLLALVKWAISKHVESGSKATRIQWPSDEKLVHSSEATTIWGGGGSGRALHP